MHGKPLEVPQFGEISSIILLGSETIRSSVDCQLDVCSGSDTNWSEMCNILVMVSIVLTGSTFCLLGASGKSFYAIGDEMIGE